MAQLEKVRVEWIDVAKAISILLVTLLHVGQMANAAGQEVWDLVKLNRLIAPVRMPLFFAASGVFAGPMLRKTWRDLLISRVALYVWLFAVWTVIQWCLCAFFLTNPANPAEGSHASEMIWAMVAPATEIWFLWTLAIYFVAAKALRWFDPRKIVVLTALLSLMAFATTDKDASGQISVMFDNLAHKNSLRYFFFFFAAANFPKLVIQLGEIKLARGLVSSLLAYVALVCATQLLPHPLHAIPYLISTIAGLTFLFLFARVLDSWQPAARVFRYIGLNTLPIYVAQIPLIFILVPALQWLRAGMLHRGALLLMPLATIFVAWAALKWRDILIRLGADWLYRLPRMPTLNRNPELDPNCDSSSCKNT